METALKLRTVINIAYSALAKIAVFILSSIASIVLARHLDAIDYGLVGFSLIIANFLSTFSDLGINSAMVQKADLDMSSLHTGFTIKLLLGIFVFIIAYAIAPLSLYFLDHPATPTVIRVLALNFIISSFALLPNCILARALDYKRLLIPQVGSVGIRAILSIVLAIAGFKFWAIIAANIAASLTSVLLLNVIQPIKLGFFIDKKIARGFIRYGISLFGAGLIIFTVFNADNFIIGSFMGAAVLGYYAIAFNWGSMICGILAETALTVLFPTFTKIQTDHTNLKFAYLKVLEYISFIAILANLCLISISEEFLYFILGRGSDKWLPALPALKILCVYGMVRAILEPVGNVIMALGSPNLLVRANMVAALIELCLLYPVLCFFGIEGVALLVIAAYASQYLVYFPYIKKMFNISINELVRSIQPAVICFISIIMLNTILMAIITGPSWTMMFSKLLLCIVGYLVLYGMITNWKLARESRDIFYAARAAKSRT